MKTTWHFHRTRRRFIPKDIALQLPTYADNQALSVREDDQWEADRIVLWPLGGIAFVNPPPRPGAVLWSIAAGPLVNVALIPIFGALVFFARQSAGLSPDLRHLFEAIRFVNYLLLIFNLLPIYPLDGGQIFRALLWFPLGQIRSLKVASFVGLIGGVGLALFALWLRSFWIGLLAFFLLSQAVNGWRHAKTLAPETGSDLPPGDPAR